ncbi:MAG TPA: archaellin/type IV pilin N-terminal domain-containing protein [Nitrososphaerales archaeon]|nr:archaellin/type IV pilin N-terminal domain-containing protein [Nitrososphaerales archaeon]
MKVAQENHYRKAISPLIATLILIAITIAGGVVVYRLFYATSNTLNNTVQIQVVEASASQAAGFAFNLKNTGTVAITGIGVSTSAVPGWTTCAVPAGGLAPGNTLSCTNGAALTAGNSYTVTFTASTASSGSANTQFTVVAGP